MSLNRDLKDLHKEVLESLPSDTSKRLVLQNKKLFNRFLEKKALQTGDTAPDVYFRDKNLEIINLYDLLKEHHVVISFFRGTWCPYCNMEMLALAKINDEINEKDARLIAVSPELYKHAEEKIQINHIEYPVYTDLNNTAASEFGLVFELPTEYREIYKQLGIHLNVLHGEDKWILPMPATFIISKNRKIIATHVDADYTQRMEPDDILEELNHLSS